MALLVRRRMGLQLVPNNALEHALIQQADRQGGRLVLDEAYYPLSNEGTVLLTVGTSTSRALRLLGLFEQAARAHAVALSRRAEFRTVSRAATDD